uniref:Uncharacterized protein n=1 Tax=viral metagenome TaxID=1070528 RepID=A0A6C0F9G5_9ZZZZ|tara:strand:+ start:698 stop:1117 length:420 start_codon:yes stop_codon:yes gene_type:complete
MSAAGWHKNGQDASHSGYFGEYYAKKRNNNNSGRHNFVALLNMQDSKPTTQDLASINEYLHEAGEFLSAQHKIHLHLQFNSHGYDYEDGHPLECNESTNTSGTYTNSSLCSIESSGNVNNTQINKHQTDIDAKKSAADL